MLLENFDHQKDEIIQATQIFEPIDDFPDTIIAPFFGDLFRKFVQDNNLEKIIDLGTINGNMNVYRYNFNGINLGLVLAPIGAPSCVARLEELLALGAKHFITFGTCGVLNNNIERGQLVIPTNAIRDEGTSYHYQPASDEISLNTLDIQTMENAFNKQTIPFIEGKTWTTDAFYRETTKKFTERKNSGCDFVDMETSAIIAWSKFRKVSAYPFFTTADNLDSSKWDQRSDFATQIPAALEAAFCIAKEIDRE
ncbi:nucleoside phosphorylase [Companilactobacillus jidongensis]|uniref:nucleoside phosphorylase n=1 Tax=Companilactobacillus jidongensis TaxID=2486006 RepID=UPI000F771C1F|nr:nucleoside phosphorylase [Companilactobacillus jidongensis]